MNKKIISIAIGFLTLLSAFYFTFIGSQEKGQENILSEGLDIETQNLNTSSETVTEIKNNQTLKNQEADKIFETAWNLFQKYLSYNKANDLTGIKSSVFKVAEVCNTEKPTEECKTRMQSAYSYGSVFEKNKFKNIWFDENQIILSTDFWTEESKELDQYGRFRSIIFFVKKDGVWKLLSFSPFKGSIVRLSAYTKNEVEDIAINQSKDEDQDGLPDYEENCPSDKTDTTCQKTDPTKRDSNANGFWDGVETLMNKNF